MTDNEIIKALEDNVNGLFYCEITDEEILDLIKRQQAEIEALINGQETLGKHIEKQKEEIDNLTNIIKARNRDNERLTLENLQMIASIKNLESKAYKEFAERVKEKAKNNLLQPCLVDCCDINNTLWELTERKEDEGK